MDEGIGKPIPYPPVIKLKRDDLSFFFATNQKGILIIIKEEASRSSTICIISCGDANPGTQQTVEENFLPWPNVKIQIELFENECVNMKQFLFFF